MSYQLRFSKRAAKDLKKLDKHTAAVIVSWLTKNIDGGEDPRIHGKGLTANLSGEWRYRIGDYRVICDIEDDNLIVLALRVAHRREVYRDENK